MLGYKISLNKFNKNEIISNIFWDHNGMILEIKLNIRTQKHSNTWRLNSMLLNKNMLLMKSRKKSKSTWKQMKMNTQQIKIYGKQQRQS